MVSLKEEILQDIAMQDRKKLQQLVYQYRNNWQAIIEEEQWPLLEKDTLTLKEINTLLTGEAAITLSNEDIWFRTLAFFYQKNHALLPYLSISEEAKEQVKITPTLSLEQIDDALYYQILYYLVNQDDKISTSTNQLLALLSLPSLLIPSFSLETYTKMIQELDELDNLIIDPTYETNLSHFLEATHLHQLRHQASKPLIEKVQTLEKLYALKQQAPKLLTHDFELMARFCTMKANNTYGQYQQLLRVLDEQETLSEPFLLALSALSPSLQSLLPHPYLNSLHSIEDIISFINQVEKTDYQFTISQVLSLLSNVISLDTSKDIDGLYQSYRQENFVFSMTDFAAYIRQESVSDPLLCHFQSEDFYRFHKPMTKMTSEQSFLWQVIAPYQNALATTEFAKTQLQPLQKQEQQYWEKQMTIYNQQVFDQYYPLLEKMKLTTDYTLSYFLKQFVEPKDYDKVLALCQWQRRKEADYFMSSIDQKDIKQKNKDRLIRETVAYLNGVPLQTLRLPEIMNYWRNLKDPSKKGPAAYPISKSHFVSLTRRIEKERLETIMLPQLEKLASLLEQRQPLLTYIQQQEYSVLQVYDMLEIAEEQSPIPEEMLTAISQQLMLEDKEDRKQKALENAQQERMETKKLALALLKEFLASDASSLCEFYAQILQEKQIPELKQRELLSLAAHLDPTLEQAYEKKRLSFKEKQMQLRSEKARRNREANPKLADDKVFVFLRKLFEPEQDDVALERFCYTYQLDIEQVLQCKTLFQEVRTPKELVALKEKCQPLVQAMNAAAYVVAKRMVTCHKNQQYYGLIGHYERFGYSPSIIGQLATHLGSRNGQLIEKYMHLHKDSFQYISYQQAQKLQSYGISNKLRVNKEIISYDKQQLANAIETLTEAHVPLQKGTLYEVLRDPDQKIEVPKKLILTCETK